MIDCCSWSFLSEEGEMFPNFVHVSMASLRDLLIRGCSCTIFFAQKQTVQSFDFNQHGLSMLPPEVGGKWKTPLPHLHFFQWKCFSVFLKAFFSIFPMRKLFRFLIPRSSEQISGAPAPREGTQESGEHTGLEYSKAMTNRGGKN